MAAKSRLRRILKWLSIAALLLLVLVIAACFIVTRSSFITGQVLPRVAEKTGTPIVAERVHLSPLSKLEVHGLRVGPESAPLLTATKVRCRYSLLALLRRELRVDELTFTQARVHIVEPAKSSKEAGKPAPTPQPAPGPPGRPAPQPAPAPPAETPPLDPDYELPLNIVVSNIDISEVTVVYEEEGTAETPAFRAELSELSLRIPDIRGDAPLKLVFYARIDAVSAPDVSVTAGLIEAELNAQLRSNLLPSGATAELRLHGLTGSIGEIDLAGRRVTVSADIAGTPDALEIRDLSVAEHAGPDLIVKLAASGSADLTGPDLDLEVALDPLTSQALNVLGAVAGGYDFGETSVTYRGRMRMQHGTQLTATGRLDVNQLTVACPAQELPALAPLNLTVAYEASVDTARESVACKRLDVEVRDADRRMVTIGLSDTVTVSLKDMDSDTGVSPATVTLAVDELPLSLVNPFLSGPDAPKIEAGTLNTQLAATVKRLGKDTQLSGTVDVNGLAISAGDIRIADVSVSQKLDARLAEMEQLTVRESETRVLVSDQTALTLRNTAALNINDLSGTVTTELVELNEQLVRAVPPPLLDGITVDQLRAKARVTTRIAEKGKHIHAKGHVGPVQVRATLPEYQPLPALESDLEFDAELTPERCSLTSIRLQAATDEQLLADISLQGTVALPPDKGVSEIALQSTRLDAQALAGLLEPIEDDQREPAPTAPAPEQPREPPAEAPTPTPREPAPPETPDEAEPTGLEGIEAVAKLDLKNITYGKILVSSCVGTVLVKDNQVSADPLDLIVNGAAIHLESAVDLGAPDLTYKTKLDIANLPFAPFLDTFAPDLATALQGGLKHFGLDIDGKGTSPLAIARNLVGGISLDLAEIRLKTDSDLLAAIPGVNLLLLPYHWLENFEGALGGPGALKFVSDELGKLKQKATHQLGKLDDMHFTEGKIAFRADSGALELTQCLLNSNLTPELSFSGALNLPDGVSSTGTGFDPPFKELQADMRVMGVPVPIKMAVGGTAKHPKADYAGSVKATLGAVAETAKNVVKGILGAAVEGLSRGEKVDFKRLAEETLRGKTGTDAGTGVPPPPASDRQPKPKSRDLLFNVLDQALGRPQPKPQQQPAPPPPDQQQQPPQPEPPPKPPAPKQAPEPQPKPPVSPREARRDALRQLGGSLLRDLMKTE